MSPDGELPEIVERPDHPWFIGVQFHPGLKSKPFDPHPLFASFIEARGLAGPHRHNHRRRIDMPGKIGTLALYWRYAGPKYRNSSLSS
jgi:hypothetical protein